jgi:cytochrome c oxidase assembly factor CtaG
MILGMGLWHPAPIVEPTGDGDALPLFAIGTAFALYTLGLARLWRRAGAGGGLGFAQVSCFFLALTTLALALLSSLDGWSDRLFSAHMAQHELLMVVAAPLFVLGRPLTAYLWALPPAGRAGIGHWLQRPAVQSTWRFLSAPLFVLILHATVRWLWHLPSLFEAAMRDERLHAFQHFTFFLSAALFWWALVHGRYGKAGYGLAVLFVFATAVHTSILGALIGVAPRLIYAIYEQRARLAGWQPLEDQELAGLIMWIPSGLLFLITALALFAAWLGEAERRAARP